LVLSNIIAAKLITVKGLVLPAAVVLFPLTYILGDVLTEVYGFKKARLVIWTGFFCNLLMAAVFMVVVALPAPSFWDGEKAFAYVLGLTPRMVAASLLAYFIGEWSNAVILSRLKIRTAGRRLWMRTIGSTIVGEGLDTVIFITLAFAGSVPAPVWGQMVLAQYLWKVSYEVLLTPFTYVAVDYLKRKENIDTYDYGVVYNPFKLES